MQMKNTALSLISIIFIITCGCNVQKARLILLPDTQTYSEKYPHVLDSQINWIIRNEKDIDFVLQQGDLTQNNSDKEWQVIHAAFTRLNNRVPYALAVGNHDMGSTAGKFADIRNSALYNHYFPYATMSSLPAFAGSFETNKSDNAYYLFESGKMKWLVITLEFGPRNAVLSWAGDIVSRYTDRIVIVNTHSYMYSDSTRQGVGDSWRPQAYGVGKDSGVNAVNDGEQIWDKLIKKHANIRWVFSGHVLNTGVGTLVSINESGLPVYQMLANYQEGVKDSENGGNGYLRIVDMNFRKKEVSITTYSPYLDKTYEKAGHNFIIKHVLFKPQL